MGGLMTGSESVQPVANLPTLLQPLLLLARNLQPLHRQGIYAPKSNAGIRGVETLRPAQPLRAPRILLKLLTSTAAAPALLQQIQRLSPWFPLEQSLQLHAETTCQSRRCCCRWITLAPGPGPLGNGAADLLLGLLRKLETQPRHNAPHESPGGVVFERWWHAETQLT